MRRCPLLLALVLTVGCGCRPEPVAKGPDGNDVPAVPALTPQPSSPEPQPQPAGVPEPNVEKVAEPPKPSDPTPPVTATVETARVKNEAPVQPAAEAKLPPPAEPKIAPPPVSPRPAVNIPAQDMKDIHLFVDAFSLAGGKMPPARTILLALVQAGSPAAKLVRSGDILLTGATQREGLWAIQKDAILTGGWVVTHNGPEQVDAEAAQRWMSGLE